MLHVEYLFYSQRATGKHDGKRTALIPPLFMQSSVAVYSDGLREGEAKRMREDMRVDLCVIRVFSNRYVTQTKHHSR